MISSNEHRHAEEIGQRESGQDVAQEAAGEAREGAELEQHMLVQDAAPQARPGHRQDVPAGAENGRQREDRHEPIQRRHALRRQPVEPHQAHRPQRDDGKAGRRQQVLPLTLQFGFFLLEAAHLAGVAHRVAQVEERFPQSGRGDFSRLVSDQRLFMSQVHIDVAYTVHTSQRLGDAGDTEGAGHAADLQLEFGGSARHDAAS